MCNIVTCSHAHIQVQKMVCKEMNRIAGYFTHCFFAGKRGQTLYRERIKCSDCAVMRKCKLETNGVRQKKNFRIMDTLWNLVFSSSHVSS